MRLARFAAPATLALALLAAPLAAEAQPAAKVPRIGLLVSRPDSPNERGFLDGLRELGYIDGRNIVIESRSTGGKDDAAPAFLAEFVQLKVDVIVTWSTPTALAADEVIQ
jgi:ABC-type uncharacterized transport system substrate-binding protein